MCVVEAVDAVDLGDDVVSWAAEHGLPEPLLLQHGTLLLQLTCNRAFYHYSKCAYEDKLGGSSPFQ